MAGVAAKAKRSHLRVRICATFSIERPPKYAVSTMVAQCPTFERGDGVGWQISNMTIFRRRLARAERPHHGPRRIAELGRSRDQRHGANHALKPADRAHNLERQLRNTVAEIRQRQTFEHDVGKATIGRDVAVLGDNQRIGRLRLVARISTDGKPVRSSGLPSAQMRSTAPIGPSQRPTARLA